MLKATRLLKNGLNVESIHPRNAPKFSPNLYRWLTKRNCSYRAWMSRVYAAADGALWIGDIDDGLIGCRLAQVLCYGAKAESACWLNLGPMVEVTDFWQRYMVDGRCAIDRAHKVFYIGDETRWRTVEEAARPSGSGQGDEEAGAARLETRECLWCGKCRQVMRRWTDSVDRYEWLPAPVALADLAEEAAA